ncbi:hypothetical protein ABVK25_004071 [Lepraria finkii]|uniref:Plastocyanin-like domain-containing protein n=1 Tax=Lepraria finkii TaxID=1340010 RepID=A0ABR4BD97_9LECA
MNTGSSATTSPAASLTENETGTIIPRRLQRPILTQSFSTSSSSPFDPEINVYNFAQNKSIRVIMNKTIHFGHRTHLHGQQMFVLPVGTGSWDAWHLSAGMLINLVLQPDELEGMAILEALQ